MDHAIIIPCNSADELMIPMLVENLRSLGCESNLFVAPCIINPPSTDLPLTPPLRWRTNFILRDVLTAFKATGCSVVSKIDVDMFFKAIPEWLYSMDSGVHGYPAYLKHIRGGCYTMHTDTASFLLKLMKDYSTDEEVCLRMNCVRNGVDIIQHDKMFGWDGSLPPHNNWEALHLGQHHPRHDTCTLRQHPRFSPKSLTLNL